MPNPTAALLPNQIVTPNVPNTGTGVLIVPANPQRSCLVLINISSNNIWLGPSTVVFVAGTQQQGTITLVNSGVLQFGVIANSLNSISPMIPWVWTGAMFAQAAAGATNAITVWEF